MGVTVPQSISPVESILSIYKNASNIANQGYQSVEWMHKSVRHVVDKLPGPLAVLVNAGIDAAPYTALRFLVSPLLYCVAIVGIVAYKRFTSMDGKIDGRNLYNGVAFAATWIGVRDLARGAFHFDFITLVWGIINLLFAKSFFSRSNLTQEISSAKTTASLVPIQTGDED